MREVAGAQRREHGLVRRSAVAHDVERSVDDDDQAVVDRALAREHVSSLP